MCSERVTTTWSASPSAAIAAAVVADHRDRHQTPPARLGQRLDHVARVARRRQRQQRVPARAVGDHLAGEDRLDADVVGDRGQDRRVLGQVDRRAGRAPRGSRRRRPSRRWPSRRCRAPAACRRARSSRAARPRRRRAPVAFSVSVCSRSAPDLLGLHQHRAAHVVEHRLELVLALVEERIQEARRAGVVDAALGRALRAGRGARRTRARAPTARGRASRPAPGGCTGRSSAARTPTRRPAGANAIVRQPRSRATAIARRRRPAPKAIAMSSGAREQRDLAASSPPSPASPIAGSARLPTITGCTNSTATWRASERAAGRAAERDQPPAAREPLGHQVAQARQPLGLGVEEPRVGLRARCQQRLACAASTAATVKQRASSGARGDPQQPVAPGLDALAGPGARARSARRRDGPGRCCRAAGRGRSRGGAAGRSC